MDKHTRELLGDIELGLDAEHFFDSRVGQEILRRAQEQVLNAIEKWKKSDTEDTKLQRELQNEVRLAELFPQWIGEIIDSGKEGERYLLTQEQGVSNE